MDPIMIDKTRIKLNSPADGVKAAITHHPILGEVIKTAKDNVYAVK